MRTSGWFKKEEILKKVRSYYPYTRLQKSIHNWLLSGCEALENPFDIHSFCYPHQDPFCNDGEPIMTYHAMAFHWSFYDEVFTKMDSWSNDTFNQIGYVEPVEMSVVTEFKTIPMNDVEAFKKLKKFFDLGNSMSFKYFDKRIKKKYDKRREHEPI